jgi:iron complex outermembrane receptor protein
MRKFFVFLLAYMAATAAFAQETPDSAASAQETDESLDFVITAGRTPEEVNKVGGQVTVITADDIAESGASTMTEVLQTAPGIRLATDNSGRGVGISMRGSSSDTGRGKVLVIVDGMRLSPTESYSILNLDMINLSGVERIEILDGGASVQYGDNAQAGVINIITKKSGAAKTDITVSGGTLFQNEQRFSHHQPTGWGGFTVSGGHRGSQGYQKHTANDTGNGELRGLFDINDTMSLQANVGLAFTNGLMANPLTKAQFDDDPTQNAGIGVSSISNSAISAGIDFTWMANEIFSFDVPVSYNFTNLRYDARSMALYNYTPHMIGFRPKITAELKPMGMGLRFTGGVDTLFAFMESKTTDDLVKETNPVVQTMSELTLGPWVLVNFEPLPLISLNAGLRYDTAFVTAHQDDWSGTVGGYPLSYEAKTESTDFNALVYEAGVTVNPFDFLKVYAKYGTQFRYPYLDNLIILTIPGVTNTIGLNTNLEPEKGWTVEGGAGLNIKGLVKLDANFYYMKVDNEIFNILNPATLSYAYLNLDPINRFGSNIGLQLTPVKYVELDFDYGFVNAEFSEGTYEGKFVPLVAKHTLSGSLMLNLFGLGLGPTVLYKSEMYQGYDNANAVEPIEPSCIWGLKARYVFPKFNGNLTLHLTVHNLADTKYASLVYALPDLPAYGVNGPTYYVDNNMGRSANLSIQYQF